MSTQPVPGLMHSKPYDIQYKSKGDYPVKISLLEDKAHFFQGQVNPLHSQNLHLKEQLIYARRVISEKTKLLKGLLPITDKNGKSRELYMETASLQEICALIQEDWMDLRMRNGNLSREIQNLNRSLEQRMEQLLRKDNQFIGQIQGLNGRILELEGQRKRVEEENRLGMERLEKRYEEIIRGKNGEIEGKNKQNETLKGSLRAMEGEMARRTDENRQRMKILQNDFDTLNQRCEQSKRLMAQVFEAQMKERVEELNRGFEAVLKGREEQYNGEIAALKVNQESLMREVEEKKQEIQEMMVKSKKREEELEASFSKRKQLQKLNQKIQSEKVRCLNEIDKLKVERAGYTQTLRQREKQLLDSNERYQHAKQDYLRERTKLKVQLQAIEAELMESKKECLAQKSEYQKRVLNLRSEFEEQMSSTNQKIKTLEQEWTEKYRRVVVSNVQLDAMIKDQKRKNEMMGKQIQKVRAEFQQKLADEKEKINQRIEAVKSEEQQRRKALQEQHKTEKVEWERIVEGKIKEVRGQMREEINELNKQIEVLKEGREEIEARHQEAVAKIMEAQKEEIKRMEMQQIKMQEEFKNDAAIREEKHKSMVKHLEEKIQLKDKEIEKQKEEARELVKAERLKFQNQLIALKNQFEVEKQALNKAFNDKIMNLTHSFQQKIQELRSLNQTESLSNQYESQISQLTLDFALEKKRMQEEYLSRVQELKTEHSKQCQEIKAGMEGRIVEVERMGEQRMRSTLEELQRIKREHERELIELSNRFQDDIGGLNDLLEGEKEEHCMTRMTKQEKIDYLNTRINEMKNNQKGLEQERVRLQGELILRHKQLREIEERINEIVEQRVKEIQEEKVRYKQLVAQQLEEKDVECAIKLKQAMEDNLRFSSDLHEEFQKMKRMHDDQEEQWHIRYEELEQLFMERPSRPEDLSIIKELKEAREGMERMVEAAEKRVKSAHDIVRYLQLELQNYKDTYDIFGPNSVLETQEDPPSPAKKLRLSTNITEDIQLARRQQNDSPFTNQRIQKEYRKSISFKIATSQLPPINKVNVEAIESKSFEVIQSAQRFMESITKANKHEPNSPLTRKRGSSIKKNRRGSIGVGQQESATIENEFQIIPRKVSIKKNSSVLY